MAGPFSVRQWDLFAQLESAFGTSPGALAGTDAFKSRTANPFKRVVARYDRDKDSGNQASVLSTQKGKEHSTYSVASDVIPSGNAATPTAADMDPFFEAHFGLKHTATAHTTLAAGSTTTVLNFAVGGVAASGVAVGDLIAVDVSVAFGVEVRQIPTGGITGDAVTVDRALSAAPAAARNVYLGTTYSLSAAQLKTLHLWGYLDGDNFRHKTAGNSVRSMDLSCDFSSQTPIAEVTFAGEGKAVETHATARPTAVTAGDALLPTEGKVWIGSSAVLCAVKAALKSDNALELRQNESCTLVPSGVKRTGNGGNFNVTQDLDMLLLTGAVEGYYDNAAALTAYDVLTQLGVTPGKIVAWRTPKFILDAEAGDQDGEVSLQMTGRAYALTTPGTEVTLAFI